MVQAEQRSGCLVAFRTHSTSGRRCLEQLERVKKQMEARQAQIAIELAAEDEKRRVAAREVSSADSELDHWNRRVERSLSPRDRSASPRGEGVTVPALLRQDPKTALDRTRHAVLQTVGVAMQDWNTTLS